MKRVSTDVYHPDFPIISVQVAGDARIAESEDGSFLDVSVCNQLPCVSVPKLWQVRSFMYLSHVDCPRRRSKPYLIGP
jgi:hypothetical protein